MNIRYSLLFISLLTLSCKNNSVKQEVNKIIGNKPDSSTTTPKPETATNPYAPVDVSPMDISYFPTDYPKLKLTNELAAPPLARVIYSRPHLGGRQLFHNILKYNERWRLGANESTEIEFYNNVSIQDKKIEAGRYIIYCIPQTENWTIVLNNNVDSWGLQPDTTKDVARFSVPIKNTSAHIEYFSMVFEKNDTGAALLMAWDNIEARLPIKKIN
jgi:hypothetical protein